MKTEIESAIKTLAEKITDETKPGDALHYTQAALNLAQVLHVKKQTEMMQ